MIVSVWNNVGGASGVTESLFEGGRAKGGADLHLGRGARGRHRNEGCTIKSRMGGGGVGMV